MKRIIGSAFMLSLLFFTIGCGNETAETESTEEAQEVQAAPAKEETKDSKDCKYLEQPGLATITQVSEGQESEHSCKNPKTVIFDFQPDEGDSQKDQYFTVDGIKDPSSEWVGANGIEIGASFPCIRKVRTAGDCQAVVYDFVGISKSGMCK